MSSHKRPKEYPVFLFNYGTPRFTLLTEVVETASGKSLDALIEDNILKPQGLGNTLPLVSQANVDSLSDILAKPYAYYGDIEDGRYDIGFTTGYGLASTARDQCMWCFSRERSTTPAEGERHPASVIVTVAK